LIPSPLEQASSLRSPPADAPQASLPPREVAPVELRDARASLLLRAVVRAWPLPQVGAQAACSAWPLLVGAQVRSAVVGLVAPVCFLPPADAKAALPQDEQSERSVAWLPAAAQARSAADVPLPGELPAASLAFLRRAHCSDALLAACSAATHASQFCLVAPRV
jgi:hypothetical protein